MPNPISDTMCFRPWLDLIISLPNKSVKWCCKNVHTPEQIKTLNFDLDILEEQGIDFFLKHPVVEKLKKDLRSGIQSQDCADCWDSERTSGVSMRTMSSRDNDFIINQNLNIDEDLVQCLELELTNKCNMACAYCGPASSNRWQKEVGVRYPDTEDKLFDKVLELLNEYWDKSLKKKRLIMFSILGGEPFFSDHIYKFIEEFMVNVNESCRYNQKIILMVTTSVNFPERKYKRFLELVKKTPNIRYEMQLSGEALGKQSEIIRWGLDFNKWDKGVDMFFEESKKIENLIIGFAPAHNNLSVPYFKEFLVYLYDKVDKFNYNKEIMMFHNWVQSPRWMSVLCLDPKYADVVQEQIDYINEMPNIWENKSHFLDSMKTLKGIVGSEVNIEYKKEVKNEYDMIENRRNISFSKHFPHYHELIEQ